MKHKFKNYLKLGILLFGISVVITSCQKDDEIIKEETQIIEPAIQGKRIPFVQSEHFGKLNSKIANLQEKANNKSTQNKIEDEDILILTDEVLYITYEDTHTYTFKLMRTNPEAYIENIVLKFNPETNDYLEYLVQYRIDTEKYVAIHQGEMLENSDSVTITNLENGFFNINMSKDCGQSCNTVWVSCNSGDHHSGNVETWAQCQLQGDAGPSAYQVCVDNYCHQDMSFDETADGSSGGGGGGGTTGTVTNPLETEPCLISPGDYGITNLDGECLVLSDPRGQTPQEHVQEILNAIQSKAEQAWFLSTDAIGNPTFEYGFIIYKENGVIKTSDLYTSQNYKGIEGKTIKNTLNQLPNDIEVIGTYHTHPNKHLNESSEMVNGSAPSDLDMAEFLLDSVLKTNSKYGSIRVIHSGDKKYIMNVNNKTLAKNWLHANNLNKYKKIKNKFFEIYNLQITNGINHFQALEIAVLAVSGNNQNGVLFYEALNNTNTIQLVN